MSETLKEKVEAQLRKLVESANATTGNEDTNITDGVNSLIDGYGQAKELPVAEEVSF